MARIDTSTIKGYEEMSTEEKLKALLGLDIPEQVDLTMFVSKETADKYASEAADLKKQLRAKMSDEEAAKAQADAERAELENKYNALLKESTVSKYKAKYLSLGYDEKLAEETANALTDGDAEKVLANGEKFKTDMEKKIRAEILKDTPKPTGGGAGLTVTKEQFASMGYTERNKLFLENKELYNELMNGGNN